MYPIDPYELGALSMEETFHVFKIFGAKDYQTENTKKIKGVPKAATKIGKNTYRYLCFPNQDTHLRKKLIDQHLIYPVIKTNKRVYNKGIVSGSGVIYPFLLERPIELSEPPG